MAESADPSCTQLRCYLPVFQAILVFTKVVPPYFATRTPALNRGEGSKNIYLRHQKKSSPGIPCFLWPLQQFGDKTEHFCGICIVLEVEPLARKVFCKTLDLEIEHSHFSTLPFRQHLQHFGVRIFDFRWLL